MSSEIKDNCKNLVIGTVAIYVTYCVASLLQEYIIQRNYINWRTGLPEKIQSSNAFVIVPSLVAWITGYIKNYENPKKTHIPGKNLFYCGMLIVLTSLAFTKAIYVTNFPIVMMFKSCGVLSVISVSVFCTRVKQTSQQLSKDQLITGLVVTIGIVFYYLGGSKQHLELAFNPFGILLLIFSLICDGFLPDFQAQIKTKFKPTAFQMFESINKWKFIISIIYSLIIFQFVDLVIFFYEHPLYFLDLLILGILGAIGQMVVFWMIKLFRQHIVPFIITTRKITTTLLSIIFFNHQLHFMQLLGIFITFVVVIYDFYREIKHQAQKQKEAEQKVMVLKSTQIEPILKGQQLIQIQNESDGEMEGELEDKFPNRPLLK